MRDPEKELLDIYARALGRGRFLRPMMSTEILDAAGWVFRRYGLRMMAAVSGSTLALTMVLVLWFSLVLPQFFLTRDSTNLQLQVSEVLVTSAITVFVALPAFLVALAFISNVVCKMTFQIILGSPPDPGVAKELASQRLRVSTGAYLRVFVKVVGVGALGIALLVFSAYLDSQGTSNLVTGLTAIGAILAGFALFFVVGQRAALLPPVLALEYGSSRDAYARSRFLIERQPPHPAAYTVLSSLFWWMLLLVLSTSVAYLSLVISESPLTSIGLMLGRSFLAEAVQTLILLVPAYLLLLVIVPLWCTGITILYVERRVRLEGYDLEVLHGDVFETRPKARFVL